MSQSGQCLASSAIVTRCCVELAVSDKSPVGPITFRDLLPEWSHSQHSFSEPTLGALGTYLKDDGW
jgi:hypothetical protein